MWKKDLATTPVRVMAFETDPVEAIERVLAHRRLSPSTKLAMLWLIEGESFRRAARRVGRSDHATLHRRARQLGILDLCRERRIERQERAQIRRLAVLESDLMAGRMSQRKILQLASELP